MTPNNNNTEQESRRKFEEGVIQLKELLYSLSAFEMTVDYDSEDNNIEVTTESGGKVRIVFEKI